MEPPTADIQVKVEHEEPSAAPSELPSEKPQPVVIDTVKPEEAKLPTVEVKADVPEISK